MPYVICEPYIDVKDAACVPECPVEPIFEDVSVPEQWESFIPKNADYFKEK